MVHWTLFFIQIGAIITCFCFSLKLLNKRIYPTYMRKFFMYPLFAFLHTIGVLISLTSPKLYQIGNTLIDFSAVLHYAILAPFIFSIQNPKPFKYVQIFLLVVGLVYVIYAFSISLKTMNNFITSSASNALLIIFGIFYFGSILTNPHIGYLKNDPGFWIVVGILIGMGAALPIFISMKQIAKAIGGENASYFRDVAFVSFTIMYLAFIKAIKCTRTT